MALRRADAHSLLINDRGRKSKKSVANGGLVQRKSIEPVDYWAFLEEIEAPMWVDLTLEAKYMNQDNDDAWFQMAHPFHRCSSHKLISAFSLSTGGNLNSNFECIKPSSPKLPPSVSRSRGKHYKSRKWGEGSGAVSINKQHPIRILGGKISHTGSFQETKPLSSFTNPKCTAYTRSSFISQRSSRDSVRYNSLKDKSTYGDTKNLCLKASVASEDNSIITHLCNSSKSMSSFRDSQSSSNTKACIVTENNQTTRFSSSMRISHTKSSPSRQHSKMEIKKLKGQKASSSKSSVGSSTKNGKQSKGCKSSPSKSSVGSSLNPKCDIKSATHQETMNKDETPESRNTGRLTHAVHYKVKDSSAKTSTVQAPGLISGSRYGRKASAAISTYQKVSKSKNAPPKALGHLKVNSQDPLKAYRKAKEKVGGDRSSRLARSSKANVPVIHVSGQKAEGKENSVCGIVQDQKASSHGVQKKNDSGLTNLKCWTKGENQRKNQVKEVQKIYFR
ncbi:PREDICTED: uncharacterized protein LOC104605686 [Nelumbo nucifera]|uniref:Uncharacterized protein n=2 Tax=Nelumbo nucifera TaxID=4432 RepID=A0A822XN57_NELNU|nr:PREDICTED: uncharacterized protein LOC104605686 [Nelumbo nucifera]DAD23054.1 TPA_asm: hypothetical protein HUJ06_024517 [Nelumbo nucifera]